eukprot:s489_g12.t3
MIAAEAICRIHHFSAQPPSNTAQTLASIELLHLPPMRAAVKAAMRGLHRWPTQELVNTVRAAGRLQLYHEALVSALSAAALRRLPGHEARDLSNTCWRSAVLALQDLPPLGRAVNKLQRGDTQALSNTLWAPGTMQMLREPSTAAASKEAFRRQDEPTAQDTSILMWCSATPFVKEEAPTRLPASCVERRIEGLSPQHLSNAARAATILSSADERPMGVFATACIHSIRGLDAQNLANSMRALGKSQLGTAPFSWATGQRALDGITEFGAQELANAAWWLGRAASLHEVLMDAVACASSQKQRQPSVQDTTNIPWRPATLSPHHDQVILFVDAEVVSRPDAFSDDASAPMLVWTMWKAGFHQGLWRLFEYWAEGSLEQVEPYGVFLMDTIWCKDVEGEASVLRRLCSWFPLRCLQMEVALLGEPIAVRRALHPAHQKVAKLVDFLEALVLEGEPAEVLAACEDFAKHKGQWLKVAGGDKADLLHATLQRPLRSGQADLVALGESQTVTPTRASKSRDLLSSPLSEVDLGHVRIEAGYDERELNEVLSFNASIYDLTIQYSCLACTGCGEGQDATVLLNLVLFLGLQVGNVFLQMFLLFEIEFLIAFPAMEHARDLYDRFTDHCYGEGLMDPSEDVGILFQSWDGTAKAELCQFPLTNPTFFFMAPRSHVYFFWHTLRLHRPTEGCVCIVDHQDQSQFVITHMSGLLKFWIALIVFLPKFIIAIVLWYIGARWLTATPGVDNLMLNSLALTFICELDELIFRTCTSENIKACLERTKLPMAPLPAGPSKAGLISQTKINPRGMAWLLQFCSKDSSHGCRLLCLGLPVSDALPDCNSRVSLGSCWSLPWSPPNSPESDDRAPRKAALHVLAVTVAHQLLVKHAQARSAAHSMLEELILDAVVTELGAFVGYSAVRFSSALRRRPGQSSLRLTSLEVNPLHVSVARFLLDMAGLSQVAEVRPGQVKDLVPQLVEELGFHSTGVCFMDHRGTIFHQDFNLLLSHKVLGAEAQLVADNTLNPGAPLFLWERFHGHHHGRVLSTTCWSLTEFLADHEDWTSTSEWRPAPTERQLG